jgi:glycerol kinase
VIAGLSSGTRPAHLARAALDAIAWRVADVLEAARESAPAEVVRVDGGLTRDDLLLQLQADLLGVPVERPVVGETTALGAAYLAGLAIDYWDGPAGIAANWALGRRFEPSKSVARRQAMLHDWHRAVDRSRAWAIGGRETGH